MAKRTHSNEMASRFAVREAWRASRGGLFAIAIFSVFINVLKLATPFFIIQVLDRVISSRSLTTLMMLAAIAIAAVLTGVILEAIRRRMFMQWGAWIEHGLGPRLFVASLDVPARERTAAPDRALKDLSRLREFLSSRAAEAWLDIPWAVAFLAIAFLINPLLGWIAAGAIVLVIVLGLASQLATRGSRRAADQASGDAREWVDTAQRSGEIVGALAMASNLAERWRRSLAVRLDETYRAQARHFSLKAATRFVRQCLRIGGLSVGVWLVIQNELTLGAVIAANIVMRIAFSTVENPMLRWRKLTNAVTAYRRIKAELGAMAQSRSSLPDGDTPVALTIEDLGHRYRDKTQYLFRHIDTTVAPGEILCVTGLSASGKTTLAGCVTGRIRPRSGHVRLGEIDVARLPPDEMTRSVGYLPQDLRLFPGSVRDNIARMNDASYDDVADAARLAGIHDVIMRLPAGYDTLIDDHTPHLSGGERKGVAIARAYFGQPRLIVLDEPEANLDRPRRRALVKALAALKSKGSIVFITSQSVRLARKADKVILLGGRKIEILESKEQMEQLQEAGSRGGSKRLRLVNTE